MKDRNGNKTANWVVQNYVKKTPNWSSSGNCCLPLFIAIFILSHSRKNLQNIASAFDEGVVSLISRLHANRFCLHREIF